MFGIGTPAPANPNISYIQMKARQQQICMVNSQLVKSGNLDLQQKQIQQEFEKTKRIAERELQLAMK